MRIVPFVFFCCNGNSVLNTRLLYQQHTFRNVSSTGFIYLIYINIIMSDTLDLMDASSGIKNIKDIGDNLLPFAEDNEPLPNKQNQTDTKFDNNDDYDYEIPDSKTQMIGMLSLFLVFMILYLGFCVCYRKVIKTHQVDDVENSERRQRQRRENRVSHMCICET